MPKKTGETAYCVRCRSKQSMVGAHQVTSAKGRNMLKGTCKKCGTKMNKFI